MTNTEKVRIDVEIDAGNYTEDKKNMAEHIARLCFLMDADKLRHLYIAALNII